MRWPPAWWRRSGKRPMPLDDRPAVVLLLNTATAEAEAVAAGLEEEGIPFVLEYADEVSDLASAAHDAAVRSRLGVGLAMQGLYACLHLKKLPPDRPFLRCTVADIEEARLLGGDAARVVKGLPLRCPRLGG
jgi:hypothetical protein